MKELTCPKCEKLHAERLLTPKLHKAVSRSTYPNRYTAYR